MIVNEPDNITALDCNTRLEKLIIEELAPAVSELPDISNEGWNLPVDGGIADKVRAAITSIIGRNQHHAIFKITDYVRNTCNDINSGGVGVILAARLYGHDLRNLQGIFHGNMQLLETDLNKIYDIKFLNHLICTMTNFRMFGVTMAYLASNGDPRFISKISASQIPYLLRSHQSTGNIGCLVIEDCIIQSPEYIALFEIAKNAPTSYILRIRKNSHIVISVHDNGEGICYKAEGKSEPIPLPPEKMHEIFEGLTAKEKGGVGLQVAKRLMELRGGHIVVETKTQNSPYHWIYSTETQKESPFCSSGKPGTTFTLYTPFSNI